MLKRPPVALSPDPPIHPNALVHIFILMYLAFFFVLEYSEHFIYSKLSHISSISLYHIVGSISLICWLRFSDNSPLSKFLNIVFFVFLSQSQLYIDKKESVCVKNNRNHSSSIWLQGIRTV